MSNMKAVVLLFFCVGTSLALPTDTTAVAPNPVPQFLAPNLGKCECVKNQCGCCALYNVKELNFNQTGCLNFTYVPADFAIQLDLLLSNSSIFQARISGKNPPALCIPLPPMPILSICTQLSSVYTDDQYLYACLNMQLQFSGITLASFSFDCARFGQNGITFFKPPPSPPSVNGQFDFNFSLANLEQALKQASSNSTR
ncbi:uncharacterized protein LOC132203050 [Neocloeon triangulifer]|uniref:uncharacterized protein LOC132203050 n=1 Tax=Neocloeon triangulifer TaxID=2078957 RepID=UPI00286EBF47|nr:uncharacterized protein LOC132203050 [Neocloeon triangulifer]XP_059486475.1 uncharacterized protein LOC132203050 [Neocloeon triangulifer]